MPVTVMTFKSRFAGPLIGWTAVGDKFGSMEQLASIKSVLATVGPVLVQHKFLCGGRASETLVFDDYDALTEYLTSRVHAGDKIEVWSLWPFMRDTPPLAHGQCPADDGTIPEQGAY